jgi:hypothetical protein
MGGAENDIRYPCGGNQWLTHAAATIMRLFAHFTMNYMTNIIINLTMNSITSFVMHFIIHSSMNFIIDFVMNCTGQSVMRLL